MKVSQSVTKMVGDFEGFFAKAYLCPAKVWTVGYGTTYIDGRKVTAADTITKEKALELLREEMQKSMDWALAAVTPSVRSTLTQNEGDALASLVYNIGIGNFKKSQVLVALNAGNKKLAADNFLNHNKGGGKVLKGLERRRIAERALFLKG